MVFYKDGNFYTSGNFFGASTSSPIDLSYNYTDTDNVFVFSWTLQEPLFTPAITSLDYELQLDTVSTFNSPDLLDYIGISTQGTSESASSPATSTTSGDTLTLNINGDGAQTIVLATSASGAAVAADIQAKVHALTANNPALQPAFSNFSCLYTTVYTLISGAKGVSSSVVVTGGTAAPALKLGTGNGGTEVTGTFTATPGAVFQHANARAGVAAPVYPRAQSSNLIFYARVRISYGLTYGDWSDTLIVAALQNITQQEVANLISNLPDSHIYPYDEAYKPLNKLSTNIGKIYYTYAAEFDRANLEAQLANNDSNIYRARDSRFFSIFGIGAGFPKPSSMPFVAYRNIINSFRTASFAGSTIEAVKAICKSFTGVNPLITPISQLLNFFTAAPETVFVTSIPVTPGPYTVTLPGCPASPFLPRNCPVVTLTSSPFTPFTFTDSAPGVGQFTVNFSTGVLTFNAADQGTSVTITYVNANAVSRLSSSDCAILFSLITEAHSIPVTPGPYTVTLANLPLSSPIIAGYTFTDSIPLPNQFSVDFNTGILTFNAANQGASIVVDYLPDTFDLPVIYNRLAAGASVLITLRNPAFFTLDLEAVKFLLNQIIPAHVGYILVVD